MRNRPRQDIRNSRVGRDAYQILNLNIGGHWLLSLIAVLVLSGGVFFRAVQEDEPQDDKSSVTVGEEAFHVAVRSAVAEPLDGTRYVFPRRLQLGSFSFMDEPAPRPSTGSVDDQIKARLENIDQRMRKLGGIQVGAHCIPDCTSASRYHVTLTGNREQPVHIESLKARIVSRSPAPTGTLLSIPPQGGGPADVVYINLDSSDKNALQVDPRGKPTGRVFTDVENRFAEQGEPLDFEIIAVTNQPVVYEFELLVQVTQDGKSEVVTIPGKGKQPFRTVGWLAVNNYDVIFGWGPTARIAEIGQGRPA